MLHFVPGDPKHQVTLNLTPDQIKAAPEFKDIAKPAPVVVAPPPQASGVGAEAPPSQPAADSANPGTAPPEPQPGSAEPQTQPQPK